MKRYVSQDSPTAVKMSASSTWRASTRARTTRGSVTVCRARTKTSCPCETQPSHVKLRVFSPNAFFTLAFCTTCWRTATSTKRPSRAWGGRRGPRGASLETAASTRVLWMGQPFLDLYKSQTVRIHFENYGNNDIAETANACFILSQVQMTD